MVLRSSRSSREMRRRDQPCAANCCIAFCSCTLRTFAIAPAVMPREEHSAEIYVRLKVGNLESVKRDHFRPEVVPFQRPLTARYRRRARIAVFGIAVFFICILLLMV